MSKTKRSERQKSESNLKLTQNPFHNTLLVGAMTGRGQFQEGCTRLNSEIHACAESQNAILFYKAFADVIRSVKMWSCWIEADP